MISAVIAAVAKLLGHRSLARYRRRTVFDPWDAYQEARAAEGCGDPQEAAKLFLEAAKAGLPVAAAFTWLAYHVGGGVHADPIAAHAWARQATALGWPEGVLEPGDGIDGHQQEPRGRPW